jgi:hypothetical protein
LAVALGVASLFAPAHLMLLPSVALLLTLITFAGFRAGVWQGLTFASLLGFVVLSYGFANWAIRVGGVPIPVGHVAAGSALALSLPGRGRELRALLRTPIARAWLLMILLAVAHLVVDLPRHGAYAARDASFALEGVFLTLGFMSARGEAEVRLFLRMLAVLFVVNLAYALTFPFQDAIRAASPVSGVFLSVPLLGSYTHTALFLLTGSLFFLLVGRRATGWPPSVIFVLAVAQAGWSLVLQVRSMYLGMALAALMLILLGGLRSGARKAVILIGAAGLLVFAVDFFQIDLRGRVGRVDSEFFLSHLRSLLLEPGTPGLGTVRWRLDLLPGLWARWTSGILNILVGEGFGEPLIDYIGLGGVAIRAPHNTHIAVAMRLGIAGLAIWIFVHARILSLFVEGLRRNHNDEHSRSLYLWMLLSYLLSMLFTSVEPWLEFSFGAVPFFTLIGFVMGLSPTGGAEVSPAQAPGGAE